MMVFDFNRLKNIQSEVESAQAEGLDFPPQALGLLAETYVVRIQQVVWKDK